MLLFWIFRFTNDINAAKGHFGRLVRTLSRIVFAKEMPYISLNNNKKINNFGTLFIIFRYIKTHILSCFNQN